MWNLQHFIAFAFNAKRFAIAILVLFRFFLPATFSGRTVKGFLANVLISVIKNTCDQDPAHSLDTPRCISVKIVPEVIICEACCTWHGLCTVASIYNIQKSTRNYQNRLPETGKQVIQIASEWNKIQGQHREKSRWSVETSEEDIQNKKLIAAPCDAI